MNVLVSVLLLISSFFSPLEQSKSSESYWESEGVQPYLAQIIRTSDDQGRNVLHINLFISSSCTTKMYYALPVSDDDLYVLTDNYGNIVKPEAQIIVRENKVFKFNGRTYKKISQKKYFDDMKLFEMRQFERN